MIHNFAVLQWHPASSVVLQVVTLLQPLTSDTAAAGRAYQCGNHNPAHIATSVEEQKQLTEKYGCTDWQPMAPNDYASESELLLRPAERKPEVLAMVSTIYTADSGKLRPHPSAVLKQFFDEQGRSARSYLVDIERKLDKNWQFTHQAEAVTVRQFILAGTPTNILTSQYKPNGLIVSMMQEVSGRARYTFQFGDTEIRGMEQWQVGNLVEEGKPVFGRKVDEKGSLTEVVYHDSRGKPVARKEFFYEGDLLSAAGLYIDDGLHAKIQYSYDHDRRGNWTRRTGTVILEAGKKTDYAGELVVRKIFYGE